MEMNILRIVLELLIVAGIWAIIELALTIRKARSSVDDLTKQVGDIATNANETIEQIQPIITKVDGMVTDLEPTIEQIQPLVEKAGTAIDVVTVDLASVNDILVDVSSVTDTASNVTSTVSKAANSAVSGVAGVVGKFTGGGKGRHRRKLAAKGGTTAAEDAAAQPAPEPESAPEPAAEPEEPRHNTYFTYGSSDDSASDAE